MWPWCLHILSSQLTWYSINHGTVWVLDWVVPVDWPTVVCQAHPLPLQYSWSHDQVQPINIIKRLLHIATQVYSQSDSNVRILTNVIPHYPLDPTLSTTVTWILSISETRMFAVAGLGESKHWSYTVTVRTPVIFGVTWNINDVINFMKIVLPPPESQSGHLVPIPAQCDDNSN
jgi:hypothetical protein